MPYFPAFRLLGLALLVSAASVTVRAEEPKAPEAAKAPGTATPTADPYLIVIKDHKFTPDTVTLPAGKEVTLTVRNTDSTPEEFESESLSREKVIAPGAEAKITVGPLDAGAYEFVGEFHEETAKGKIVVN